MAHQSLREPAKAEQAFRSALGIQPDYHRAQVALIRMQLAQGDTKGATAAIDALLVKAPSLVEALLLKADLQIAAMDVAGAKATLKHAIESDPRALPARSMLISMLAESKEFPEAEAQYADLVKVSPGGLVTRFMRSVLDYRQGKIDQAATGVADVLRVAPDFLPALTLAATVALGQNSLEQAESHAKKVNALAPNSLQGIRLLAAVYLQRGDYERTLQLTRSRIDRGLEDPVLLALAGEAALRRNDTTTANDYLARAARLDPKDPNKRTVLGLAGIAAGNTQMGFTELQNAAELDAKSTRADLVLIAERMRLKQFDEALSAVAKLEKKQPENPLGPNLRGSIQMTRGDTAGARASFARAIELDPKFFPAAANLAQLDLRDNKPDDAKKRFTDLLAKDPKNAQAGIALAEIARRGGASNEEITRLLQQAADASPQAIEPMMALAQHLTAQDKARDAIPLVQKALAQQPESAQLLDALGQLYLRTSEKQQAIETYEKVTRLFPSSAQAFLRLGEVKARLGDINGAMAAYRTASELDRRAPGPQFGMAALLLKEGKRDEALKVARSLQQQMPKSWVGMSLEGDVMAWEKKWSEAATLYRKALALEKVPNVVAKLHNALKESGQKSEAEAALRDGIQAMPDDVALRLYAAEGAMAAGQWKVAVDHYERVTRIAPGNAAALNNLAWSLHSLKDPRALSVAEDAYAKAPQSAAIMDTLAVILMSKGDDKRSVELLKKATELAPSAADIRFHYAQALAQSGAKDQARAEADAIAKTFPNSAQATAARELVQKL